MSDDYDILATVDPRLVAHLQSQGMGTEQMMTQLGLLGTMARMELEETARKHPELVDKMRAPEARQELHEAVSRQLNAHADALKQCHGVDALKSQFAVIAKAAAADLTHK